MILESIETQKIVNRLIKILGKNINIMSRDGIIIASGDAERINTFHEGAKAAASEKRNISIYEDNLRFYKGCRPGVNIPIYYEHEVLGVVGITGDPGEVEDHGLIVKELVELMIQEEQRNKLELFQARALKSFAKEIIKYHDEGDFRTLKSRAEVLEFDANIKRAIIAADIMNFTSLTLSGSDKSEIMIQDLKQQIVDIINRLSNPKYDIAFNLSEDRFIILKSLDTDLKDFCVSIENAVYKKTSLKLYMGIGSVCESLADYPDSYTLANKTLDIGRKLHRDKLVYPSEDYRIQLLLQAVGEEQKKEYINGLRNIFTNRDSSTMELFNTIKAYFENGMNIKNTSNAMFIHRNTVLYRINKFKEFYGIDITDPCSCMMIYIGIVLKELQ